MVSLYLVSMPMTNIADENSLLVGSLRFYLFTVYNNMSDSEESGYEDFLDAKKKPVEPGTILLEYNKNLYTFQSLKELKREKLEALENDLFEKLVKSWKNDVKKTIFDETPKTVRGRLTKRKLDTRSDKCFNCLEQGHKRSNCDKPQTEKYCYVCGKRNFTRKDCPNCKKEYMSVN